MPSTPETWNGSGLVPQAGPRQWPPAASQCCSFASGEHYKAWDVTPLGPSSVRPGETTYQCSMYSSEPSSTKPATNASAGKTPAAPS